MSDPSKYYKPDRATLTSLPPKNLCQRGVGARRIDFDDGRRKRRRLFFSPQGYSKLAGGDRLPAGYHLAKGFEADRLGHIIIHARPEALGLVARECIGRHGNDARFR